MTKAKTKNVIELLVLVVASLVLSYATYNAYVDDNVPLLLLFGFCTAVDVYRVEQHWAAL